MPTEHAPRVSIITPVYNAERFVERTIRSALAQSYGDWEQIVVDDGSTDATPDIVRGFTDSRIRYIRLPHRGLTALAETYNIALRAARGALIGILEGDDAWPANKLELQLPCFDAADVALSWGRSLVIDESHRIVRRWPVPRVSRRDTSMAELFRLLARWNVLPALTVMVRRSALERIGGFRQLGSYLMVDLPTWLMLTALVDGRARFVDRDLGLYRVHASSTGMQYNASMRFEHQKVVSAVMAEIGPERLQQLGWSAVDERVARASASLTQGIAQLHRGERGGARASFAATLRATSSPKEYLTALAGYGSALLGVNMIARAQKLRLAAATLSMKLRM